MKKGIIHTIISFLIILLITSSTLFSQTSQEKNIKAVFIYNFTRYISWSNFDSTDFFKIGIYGKSEIIEPLQEIAAKKHVHGKQIQIRQCSDTTAVMDCDIIILSNSMMDEAETILKNISVNNVLIIGESEGFVEYGAAIDFVFRDGNLKFEINQQALKNAGLVVSSQLLKLAILVE